MITTAPSWRRWARPVATLLAVAATLALAAAPAIARSSYETHVKIISFVDQEGPPDPVDIFDGKLSSKHQACVTDRTVKLYRRAGGPDKLIAKARASDEGFWFVHKEDPGSGRYYAKAPKVNVGSNRHPRICEKGVSPDYKVVDT